MHQSPMYCHVDLEAEHQLLEEISTRSAAEWITDVHKFAPHLVHLLRESRQSSIDRLKPTVREIVLEQSRAQAFNANADDIDRHVSVILEAMEQVRREQLKCGKLSDAPVPPLMFG